MTVPTDSLYSDLKQGKLRPLTSLPMPMLPTEQQLKGTAHQLPGLPSRSRGAPQNSILSTWLSSNNNNYNSNINSSNNGFNGFSSNTSSPRSSTVGADQGDRHSSDNNSRFQSGPHAQHGHHHAIDVDRTHYGYFTETMEEQRQKQYAIDAEHSDQSYTAASPINATTLVSPSPQPFDYTDPTTPEKRKRGRKPKSKAEEVEEEDSASGSKSTKEKKPKTSKEPKPPKDPKPTKELKQKKSKKDLNDGISGTTTGPGIKADRSILSFFDRSASTPSLKQIGATQGEDNRNDIVVSTTASPKASFKQSCLSFDVLDPSKTGSYFSGVAAASREEDKRFGGFMRELPRLTGRAPFEDLLSGMLMRSSKLPNLTKLNLHHPEFDMDMLADVKMIHEFLNTFGTPLGLTKDSGEWITLDLLLSMIRNPRIDSRLLELNSNMVMAAYDKEQSPKIDQYNFPYFLAVGPDARSTFEERKENKKNKHSGSSREKSPPMSRLGTMEYSVYTISDRIEALVKALHDITSSDRFHRFMRDEVEENITALKRQKRKRAEVRKELETQTHDLEREMKAIEREAAELETKRQAILTSEREGGLAEDEAGATRITATSRLQRLAQAKDARTKANDLLNQQKTLANDLKVKESTWESKKEELEEISLDDTEVQKDHNVPLTQLRGGYVVNTDDKLRVICLGSDRWGRKYWFWKEFGGVIIEDRAQVGPRVTETIQNANEFTKDTKSKGLVTTPDDGNETIDESLNDVMQRMKTMAQPDLAGDKFQATRERMSISNLLADDSSTYESPLLGSQLPKSEPAKSVPEKDLLDYGPIQTWSLISTTKELASVTRALNAKGIRERILKASLIAMRKDIEASFCRIKSWAGDEYSIKNEHTISVMGTVGQPLSEEDLILLKKKRGRKSKQELADIAATQVELATAGNDSQVMELDSVRSPASSDTTQPQDIEMDYEGSDHELQYTHEGDNEIEEKVEIAEGFMASTRSCDSGPLPTEFLESIIRAAEEKLKNFSRAICDGDPNAIQAAITNVRAIYNDQDKYLLPCIVKVLERCLQLMDEPEVEGEDQENQSDTNAQDNTDSDNTIDTKTREGVDADVAMGEMSASPPVPTPDMLSISIPVSVNPRLLSWLETCHIHAILKDVKTFGALHAWLDECIDVVESVVYDTDDGNDEEEGLNGIWKKKNEDEAEEDENDEEEDEGEDEEEHDHEDEEEEHEDEGNDEEKSRQRKNPKEIRLRITTIRGRALRARNNKPISYKDNFKNDDHDDEEEEEEREEDDDEQNRASGESDEEGIVFRLRRIAKHMMSARHSKNTTKGRHVAPGTGHPVSSVDDHNAYGVGGHPGTTVPPTDVHSSHPVQAEGISTALPPGHSDATAGDGHRRRNVVDRLKRMQSLLRDLTLMLLVILAFNTFGRGSGVTALILTWIYFVIAILWVGAIFLLDSHILNTIFATVAVLILLAISIVAYSTGWPIF
ncbi:hypothetical protein BGX27_007522 [Mortierella sp. AM989]|nr:hypothetical protein BGX27_007522 [Mortierella sp. AM989]